MTSDREHTLDALMPAEMAAKAEQVGVTKANMPLHRLVPLGLLAGAFIALGANFSAVVTADTGISPGISRLLGGVVFSLGLILVVISGAELFTGNTLIVMAYASRRITARDGSLGTKALKTAAAKADLGFGHAIISGILANMLVCLAVWMTLSARTIVDKVMVIVPPIAAFVAAGYEHSVANMYFFPAALFHKAWAPDSFWTATDTTATGYPHVTWGRFLYDNLLPVTIGNIIGGAVLVGLVYWFVFLKPAATTAAPDAPPKS